MRRKKHLLSLVIGIVSLAASAALTYFVDPTSHVTIASIKITPIPFFFVTLLLGIYYVTFYITRAKKHAGLLSTFVISYLLLRFYDLHHPLFPLLLAALFLMLELFFVYQPKNDK